MGDRKKLDSRRQILNISKEVTFGIDQKDEKKPCFGDSRQRNSK